MENKLEAVLGTTGICQLFLISTKNVAFNRAGVK